MTSLKPVLAGGDSSSDLARERSLTDKPDSDVDLKKNKTYSQKDETDVHKNDTDLQKKDTYLDTKPSVAQLKDVSTSLFDGVTLSKLPKICVLLELSRLRFYLTRVRIRRYVRCLTREYPSNRPLALQQLPGSQDCTSMHR